MQIAIKQRPSRFLPRRWQLPTRRYPSRLLLTQAVLPVPDVTQFLLAATEIATGSLTDPRRQSLLKMMACILNKSQNEAQTQSFISSALTTHWLSKHDQ